MTTKLIETRLVPLTRELATEFATMKAWRGELRLQKARLDALGGIIENGKFKSPQWAFAWFRGEKIRVNGQHSSVSLHKSNGHFPERLKATVEEWSVDNEEDIAELFQRYDANFSVRTAQDNITAIAASCPELADRLENIAPSTLGRIANGIVWFNHKGPARLSVRDRGHALHESPDFVIASASLIKKKNMQRAPVVAAMYGTWLKDPDGFQVFWKAVNEESDPSPKSPSRTLAKYLASIEAHDNNQYGDARCIYAKCIHGWNAFRKDDTTELRYYKDADLPAIQ